MPVLAAFILVFVVPIGSVLIARQRINNWKAYALEEQQKRVEAENNFKEAEEAARIMEEVCIHQIDRLMKHIISNKPESRKKHVECL